MPIDEVLRSAFGVDPATWQGPLRLLAAGKAGELFFLTGVIPAIRRRLPKAEIVVHCVSHYAELLLKCVAAPDRVSVLPSDGSVVDSVEAWSSWFSQARNETGFFELAGGVAVFPYRTMPWAYGPFVSRGSFYEAFCDAVGIPRREYQPPEWRGLPVALPAPWREKGLALAFPTANRHTGRVLPFSTREWEEAAARARAQGLVPVATGHGEDGLSPEMPNWHWVPWTLEETISVLWHHTKAAVGFNSGILFVAARALWLAKRRRAEVRPARFVDASVYPDLRSFFRPEDIPFVLGECGDVLGSWP